MCGKGGHCILMSAPAPLVIWGLGTRGLGLDKMIYDMKIDFSGCGL